MEKGIKQKIIVNPAFTVGKVDERLYGTFLEHIHTIVYGLSLIHIFGFWR